MGTDRFYTKGIIGYTIINRFSGNRPFIELEINGVILLCNSLSEYESEKIQDAIDKVIHKDQIDPEIIQYGDRLKDNNSITWVNMGIDEDGILTIRHGSDERRITEQDAVKNYELIKRNTNY